MNFRMVVRGSAAKDVLEASPPALGFAECVGSQGLRPSPIREGAIL